MTIILRGAARCRSRDEYGFSGDRVSIRLTSADVAAMRAALDKLDTTKADADLADELEAP